MLQHARHGRVWTLIMLAFKDLEEKYLFFCCWSSPRVVVLSETHGRQQEPAIRASLVVPNCRSVSRECQMPNDWHR